MPDAHHLEKQERKRNIRINTLFPEENKNSKCKIQNYNLKIKSLFLDPPQARSKRKGQLQSRSPFRTKVQSCDLTMSRSSKKGPFVDQKLIKKVMLQKQSGDKAAIKTWSRASQIPPEFVGHTFAVHNGKNFINVFIAEGMVGHRLGEFAPTRTFRSHGRVVAREISKT